MPLQPDVWLSPVLELLTSQAAEVTLAPIQASGAYSLPEDTDLDMKL